MITIKYLIVISCLCICSLSDLKSKRISKIVVGIFLMAALLSHFISSYVDLNLTQQDLLEIAPSGLIFDMIPGLICIVLSCATRQSFGLGDSLLILITGIILGYWSCISILMIAAFGSMLWAGLLLLRKKASWKTEIPFVPFLLAGTIVEWTTLM